MGLLLHHVLGDAWVPDCGVFLVMILSIAARFTLGLSRCARRGQNTLPTSPGHYAATGGRGDIPGLRWFAAEGPVHSGRFLAARGRSTLPPSAHQ